MPRTNRAAQTVVRTGLQPTYSAVDQTNGESFVNDGAAYMLHVKNTNGSTRTVTLKRNVTIDAAVLPDLVVTIPATTGDVMIGPFPVAWFLQSDGTSQIDYSASAGLAAALIKLTL